MTPGHSSLTSHADNIKRIFSRIGIQSGLILRIPNTTHQHHQLFTMNYRRALKKLIQKTKAYKNIMFGQNNKVKSEEKVRARKTQTLSSTEKRRYSYSSADFTIIEDIEMFREEFMEDQYYEPVGNYYEECFDFHYESEDDYEIIEYKSVR